MIDFSHPEWQTLARRLLAGPAPVVRARQLQPLVGLLKDHQLLRALGNQRYELTPAGRHYLTRELALAEMAGAPPEPEEWLLAHGWQLGELVNESVLAALYRKGEANFSPIERSNFEDKGIGLCGDRPLRLRASRPFSLFFSGGALLDATPWLQALGEVALPERTLPALGKILWGAGEIQRVISTDSVGVFAELLLPEDALLVWMPADAPAALTQLIAALPPQVVWSHLTALDPAGVARVLALAHQLGRPANWWLPQALAPIVAAYASPLTEPHSWEPSRLPRPLLTLCSELIASNQGLAAEVCALAPTWHAVG